MNYFSLFSCCSLTKGAKKSCLIDFERAIYCSIPNDLYEILKNKFNLQLIEIKKNYSKKNFKYIKRYIESLRINRFIYFHSKKQKNTLNISNEIYSNFYEIEDLLIDINSFEHFNLIINKISTDVETLQLRIFYSIPIIELQRIAEVLRLKEFVNLEIIMIHNVNNNELDYASLFQRFQIISKIFIMNYPINKHIIPNHVISQKQRLTSSKQCGIINENLFYPNLKTYLTSMSCNSCLHRKISIDVDGNIKNCPSMTSVYGHISTTSIESVLSNRRYITISKLTKDKIDICKDCEFRYICPDCRAYIQDSSNILSKPKKCNYDPYTATWC